MVSFWCGIFKFTFDSSNDQDWFWGVSKFVVGLEDDLDVSVRECQPDGVAGGAWPGDLLSDHIPRPLPDAEILLRHLVSHLTQNS